MADVAPLEARRVDQAAVDRASSSRFQPVAPGLKAPAGPGEEWLVREVWHRVHVMNLNCVITAVGPPGSTKSWTGLRVGEELDPDFGIGRVIFPGIAYIRVVADPSVGVGAFVVWDDAGLGAPSREFWSELNRFIGLVFQSSRFRRLIVWVTLPDKSFLDSQPRKLVNIHLEFIARTQPDQPASARVYLVKSDSRSGKTLYQHPRIRGEWGDEALEIINFYEKPSAPLAEAYEELKADYMMGFYKEKLDQLETGGIRLDDYHSKMLLLLVEYARALGKTQRYVAGRLGIREDSLSTALRRARKNLKLGVAERVDEDVAASIAAQLEERPADGRPTDVRP